MSLKEKLMNQMMDKQFDKMSSEEKQKMMESMMDKFFSGMTDEDKKEMMNNMMPKMMGQMMGSSTEGNPMMGMMHMMMGGQKGKKGNDSGKMPWDNCMEMMSGFKETTNSTKFATPELRRLFEEWCTQIEQEIFDFIQEKKEIMINSICEKFNLSEESVKYLLSQMSKKGIIDYKLK